ncbi:MAG: nicotinate phosphoribosyltransferase [SAR324 cluster bacterium]|nr:nicotinate phosphoribosyltransferase [SAR324 cluster bacterium]MCH8886303.1 nicotinate phosphoribosyltransferase [SAR324 cluster bacterium]
MLASFLRDDPSLALATDLYELSMAQGFWNRGMTELQAEFHMFYRQNPFGGGYVVWAGLENLLEALSGFRFSQGDLDYLSGLKTRVGGPLFEEKFLSHLENFRFTCSVDAVPEGSVVFPNEPLVRVRGPILEAQMVETLLLSIVNYQSLIATKAARVVLAAQGDPVFEFGLRRAPGLDGGFSASRAAYIGGCRGTSNVLAGKWLGIQVAGTFAHSWVMAFDTEGEAFDAFASAMPDNCVFLVDTYDSLEGLRHAARVGQQLKAQGHNLAGIRLDSGDLTYLSIQARRVLDEAGLEDAFVMASGDLDEWLIRSMKSQDAKVNAWGVGTRLVTGYGDPALGGVYKLSAVKNAGEEPWRYKLKVSEQKLKTSIPGVLQVYRCSNGDGKFIADAILDDREKPGEVSRIIDPNDNTKSRSIKSAVQREPLLERYLENGTLVRKSPSLDEIRDRAARQLELLDASHKRFENPHIYPVGLSPRLNTLRDDMIAQARAVDLI